MLVLKQIFGYIKLLMIWAHKQLLTKMFNNCLMCLGYFKKYVLRSFKKFVSCIHYTGRIFK